MAAVEYVVLGAITAVVFVRAMPCRKRRGQRSVSSGRSLSRRFFPCMGAACILRLSQESGYKSVRVLAFSRHLRILVCGRSRHRCESVLRLCCHHPWFWLPHT